MEKGDRTMINQSVASKMMARKTHNGIIGVVVIGAGVRGSHLARQLPSSCEVVGVADPNCERRTDMAIEYGLTASAQFASWEDFIESSLECDAVIIATMDNQHTGPALACLRRGCHLLIEKPLSDTLEGCLEIERMQRETGLVVSVCHTLRYMDAFRRIKQIVADGVLGRLIHIDHMEAIDHLRFTHNYVRGRWAKEVNNTFLLLHKCSHDVDFIAWLADEACFQVSSFGSLCYFTPANAPTGSNKRCLDCPLRNTCLYSAVRLYVDGDLTGRIQDIGNTHSLESRLEAIRLGPFGACVWQADNDVVDHQVVSMEFASGMTATCTMSGYSATHGRRTRLQGTKGELLFDEAADIITVKKFAEAESEKIRIPKQQSYHPEDRNIVENWTSAIRNASTESIAVNAQEALKTHAIIFAAELSRKEKRIVHLSDIYNPAYKYN